MSFASNGNEYTPKCTLEFQPSPYGSSLAACNARPLYNPSHTHVLRIPWSAAVGCQLFGIVTGVGIRVKLLLCCLAEAVQLSGQQKSTDKHTHMQMHTNANRHTHKYKPILSKQKAIDEIQST